MGIYYNTKEFIKGLVTFDVFWGRRSKIYHGVQDGGADATALADPDKALVFDGKTIYNVNHEDNEPHGGHYHDPIPGPPINDQEALYLLSVDCFTDDSIGDWVRVVSSNKVQKTDNSVDGVVGVIISKITTTKCHLVTFGRAALFTGLIPGSKYYLSTIAGQETDIPPVGPGGFVTQLGIALTPTTMVINIRTILERGNP